VRSLWRPGRKRKEGANSHWTIHGLTLFSFKGRTVSRGSKSSGAGWKRDTSEVTSTTREGGYREENGEWLEKQKGKKRDQETFAIKDYQDFPLSR